MANNNNKDIKKKHFFKDFKAELKKVIWPTPKQLMNNTIAVITIVLIAAAIVFVLDLVFNIFNEYGVNKLKSSIKNKVVTETVIEDDSENSTVIGTGEESDQDSTAESE